MFQASDNKNNFLKNIFKMAYGPKKSHVFSKFIFVWLTCICICHNIFADTLTIDKVVKREIPPLMNKYTIPGIAVIVYQDGQTYEYNFGVMSRKSKKPVTKDTIFELGSITKSFTGVLLAQQVNSDMLNLNDPISKLLNNNITYSNSIKQLTPLELATHTSGLPYVVENLPYNASATPKNKQTLNHFLHTWVASYKPETATLYSNIGFSLLGQALANNSQTSLFTIMQENLLAPLHMTNSFFSATKSMMSSYANGYTADGVLARTPSGGLYPGSWAMKSTPHDMKLYLSAAIGDSDTPESIFNAFKMAQTGYFVTKNGHQLGLGWNIIPLANSETNSLLAIPPLLPSKHLANPVEKIIKPSYNPNALIEKTGATNGFRAYIGVIPEQKVGVVILTNRFIYDPSIVEYAGREILFNLKVYK